MICHANIPGTFGLCVLEKGHAGPHSVEQGGKRGATAETEHAHAFAVDVSCECGIMLSAYVKELTAENARLKERQKIDLATFARMRNSILELTALVKGGPMTQEEVEP